MQSDSLEFSLLSIFSFLSFFTFFIIQKMSHKILNGLLFDNDFDKPQAFHNSDIPRSGGLASVISFCNSSNLSSNFFLISSLSTIIDKVVFKPFLDCICTFINIWWARRDSNS